MVKEIEARDARWTIDKDRLIGPVDEHPMQAVKDRRHLIAALDEARELVRTQIDGLHPGACECALCQAYARWDAGH
jgi:hypothetical protein